MDLKTSKCKGCGKDIAWVTMASGKAMPLDVPPFSAIQVKEEIGEVIQVFRSHFATCSHAKTFRKDKQKQEELPL